MWNSRFTFEKKVTFVKAPDFTLVKCVEITHAAEITKQGNASSKAENVKNLV